MAIKTPLISRIETTYKTLRNGNQNYPVGLAVPLDGIVAPSLPQGDLRQNIEKGYELAKADNKRLYFV